MGTGKEARSTKTVTLSIPGLRMSRSWLVIGGCLWSASVALAETAPGRITLDARLGAAVSLVGSSGSLTGAGRPMLASSLALGIAVTPDRRGRVLLAPELVYTAVLY